MKELFTNDSHALTLFLGAAKLIEEEHKAHMEDILTWAPETISTIVNTYVEPNKLSNSNFNKIMAIKTLLVTDAIWDNWELFLPMVQSLNGLPLSREVLYITDHPLPYLYNAVNIMNMVRKQDFSEEIARFCAAVFLHENVYYAPEDLEFCQLYISNPKYKCKTCGQEGSALPPFNYICPSCSKMFDASEKDRLFNFQPKVLDKSTTNTEIRLENEYNEVKERFLELQKELKENQTAEIKENHIDQQCKNLLISLEYEEKQNDKLALELHRYNLT